MDKYYQEMIAGVLLAVLLCLGACSCSRKVAYVPVESSVSESSASLDSTRFVTVHRDSIVYRDSVSLVVRNDTVYLSKFRDRVRVNVVRDTVVRFVADSVFVERSREVPIEVEKSGNNRVSVSQWCIIIGLILLISGVGFVCIKFVKKM